MNIGRVIYHLAQVYVGLLVVLALLTVGWLLNPQIGASPSVAGLWFAVGGFGVLVVVTILLVHFSRS